MKLAPLALLPQLCLGIGPAGPPVEPPGSCIYNPETHTMDCDQAPSFQIIQPPADGSAAAFAGWWQAVSQWRDKTRAALKMPSKWYDDQQLAWAATSYLQPQAMLHDRLLFNNSLERGGGEGWTIDIYLDDLDERYGGIDSVLLWHSYPVPLPPAPPV